MKYIQLVGFGLLIVGALYIRILHGNISDLKIKNKQLKAEAIVIEQNLALAEQQIETEAKAKIDAHLALIRLQKEVTNEEFNEQLPKSIQQILDTFHERTRNDNGTPFHPG